MADRQSSDRLLMRVQTHLTQFYITYQLITVLLTTVITHILKQIILTYTPPTHFNSHVSSSKMVIIPTGFTANRLLTGTMNSSNISVGSRMSSFTMSMVTVNVVSRLPIVVVVEGIAM